MFSDDFIICEKKEDLNYDFHCCFYRVNWYYFVLRLYSKNCLLHPFFLSRLCWHSTVTQLTFYLNLYWTIIMKTCLYNFDPLEPYFYIVNLGFTRVYIIFLILLKNMDCGCSLELPHWGSSNECPQSMFWAEIWKVLEFLSEIFQFLEVKFSIYLNRRVFVMYWIDWNPVGLITVWYRFK